MEIRGPLSFLVDVAEGKRWRCHIDHIKELGDSPSTKTDRGSTLRSSTVILDFTKEHFHPWERRYKAQKKNSRRPNLM